VITKRVVIEGATTQRQDLVGRIAHLEAALARVTVERDKLRRAYEQLKEQLELLRRRIFTAKAERIDVAQLELEFAATKEKLRAMVKELGEAAVPPAAPPPPPPDKTIPKPKPTGRRHLGSEDMPEERVEILDPALEGTSERIGFEESFKLSYRRGGPVRVVVARATYKKVEASGAPADGKDDDEPVFRLITVKKPKELFERGLLAPTMIAHLMVRKYRWGIPFHRLARMLRADGVKIDDSTMGRYAEDAGATLGCIVEACAKEAREKAFCLSTDATGVCIQPEPVSGRRQACRKGHFFVVLADHDHVFFEYQAKHTSAAVCEMFRGFTGYIQADAHAIYDAIFRGEARACEDDKLPVEVGCWSHCRRKAWEAAVVAKDPAAREALWRMHAIFELEASWRSLKWTPDFGPGVKVVRGACSNRERSSRDEEHANEAHPRVQGEGRDRGAARAGDDPRPCEAVPGAPESDLQVEARVHRERGARVLERHARGRERQRRARGAAPEEDRGADGGARFFIQRARAAGLSERRAMIDRDRVEPSVRRQCEMLRVSRSGLYYEPEPTSPDELALMRRVDELHLKYPFYGSRKLSDVLRKEGHEANRKRIQRLMRLMGMEAMAPKPKTSEPHPEHVRYPYLLRGLTISRASRIWSRSWSGTRGASCRGACRTRSTRASASRPWRRRSLASVTPRSSTRTKERSSRPTFSPSRSATAGSPSAWMAKGVASTTSSSSDSGGRSSTRRSTSTRTMACARLALASGGTWTSTTTSGPTRRSATRRRRRSTVVRFDRRPRESDPPQPSTALSPSCESPPRAPPPLACFDARAAHADYTHLGRERDFY